MRLIDADELMKTLMHEGLGYQYNRVMCAPTVDAVPVIRCKNCKYSTDEYGDGDCYCDLSVKYIGKDWNHFCSWAERKEE